MIPRFSALARWVNRNAICLDVGYGGTGMFGESVIVKNCSGHATRHPNEDAEKAAAFYNTSLKRSHH